MDDIIRAEKFILRELIKRRIIGGKHTPLDRVTKNLPDEFLHQKNIIEKAVRELCNSGMIHLLHKKTGRGSDTHVSINPRAWKDIGAFLELPPPHP